MTDVAYEILLKEPELAYAVNEGGITPLHLLASKPSVFRSGSHIGWWKSIIYHCMHVEELEHETVDKRLIDSAIKELDKSSIDDVTHKFPNNYHTCIQIYQVLQTLAQFASTGRLNICILLAAKLDEFLEVKDSVVQEFFHNNAGESPLFLAAFHGNRQIFLYLHLLLLEASDTNLKSIDPAYRRNDGETALHSAIMWEYFDSAFEILQMEPSLAYAVNELGITPLDLLASIHVEELEHKTVRKELVDLVTKGSSVQDITHKFPENYLTCIALYQVLLKMAQSVIERCKGRNEDVENPNTQNVIGQSERKEGIRRIKQKHVYSVQIMKILVKSTKGKEANFDFTSGSNPGQTINRPETWEGLTSQTDSSSALPSETELEEKKNVRGKEETPKMEKIETPVLILLPEKRKMLETAKIEIPILVAAKDGITKMVDQILQNFPTDTNDISKEKTETVILLATRNGITEMVEYILKEFPVVINCMNKEKNIVLLAAENRQTHVLQHLLEQEFVKCKLIHEVDANENNALHLAAQIGKQKPWLIPGAALQMQWEIKWYEV
nr:hypothetical protein CFP56_55387 [Quercus suber]